MLQYKYQCCQFLIMQIYPKYIIARGKISYSTIPLTWRPTEPNKRGGKGEWQIISFQKKKLLIKVPHSMLQNSEVSQDHHTLQQLQELGNYY